MKKAAIYCRLSEEDRNKANAADDSESIQNQKSMLIQYALEHGWEIYNIYSDDDYAGADRKRPEWNKLLSDAENKFFDIILCKSQARFTRELELVEKYIHGLFPLWGIRFVSIADNADTENPGNKKSRQINGLVNEWYLEDLSENIKSVFDDKRKKGIHIGSFALYGYKKDPDNKGHLIIDEEAAEVVREVFRLFVSGYGKSSIARILNQRGIPNPTEYKRMKGLRYSPGKAENSKLWRYYTVASMLKNEIYIGNMVQGRYGSVSYKVHKSIPRPKEQWYRVEGTHDAIIDTDTWNRAQRIINQRSRPAFDGKLGIFTGKVICANCGYVCRSAKSHGLHYLKCGTRADLTSACPGAFIPVKELEEIVLKELNKIAEIYLDKDTIAAGIKLDEDLNKRIKSLEGTIKKLQSNVNDYDKALKSLYMDKIKGVITENEFLTMKEGFESDKESALNQVSVIAEQLEDLSAKRADRENREEIIEKYMQLDHLDRDTVQILIDKIYISKRNPITKQVPVEIHWNF